MTIPKITFSSQRWAEKHHHDFEKIISIYDHGSRRPTFEKRAPGSVRYTNFHDHDFFFLTEDRYPTEQDIRDFLTFCTASSPSSILIHCKMGIARSSALTAILLGYLHPHIPTKTIFQNLRQHRADHPTAPYPTRTLLAPAQTVLNRSDLLATAYATSEKTLGYDRISFHARSSGLPHEETAKKLTKLLAETPSIEPFRVTQSPNR